MRKFNISVDGRKFEVGVKELDDGKLSVEYDKKKFTVQTEEILSETEGSSSAKAASSEKSISALMPGTIGKIKVKPGSSVKQGELLLTIIAMKMENEMHAGSDCKVKSIHVKEGQNVEIGTILIEFE